MPIGMSKNAWLNTITKPIVKDGLIFHVDAGNDLSYPGSGTTWFDLSGNGLNGTLTNGPTYDSANKGGISFDGSNDVVNFGNVLNIGTNPFTIQICFRFSPTATSVNYGKVASKGAYLAGGWTIYAGKNPNGIYGYSLQYGNNSTGWLGLGGATASPGDFVFYTITRDSSNTMTSYTGNTLVGSKTETFNFSTNYNLTIGRRSDGIEPFKGIVYYFTQYNRALSSTEISQNFNALRGRYGI